MKRPRQFLHLNSMFRALSIVAIAAGMCAGAQAQQAGSANETAEAAKPEILSVEKIWDEGPHNAFTDLVRFQDKWFCTFREDVGHVGGDGKIRVIVSETGDAWESAALLAEEGVDLRDPKLSITPDNRLMLSLGGSVYEDGSLVDRQPRVAFSEDGHTWTAPQRILESGDWLWRVTWHKGTAYGINYVADAEKAEKDGDWAVELYSSENGKDYTHITDMDVPGYPNEATVRFVEDAEMVALVRREGWEEFSSNAWIGTSMPPYTDWTWHETDHRIGGPNFIQLPDGNLWAAGRIYPGGARTMLMRMTRTSLEPVLELPSGGDTSYPGLVWHDGILWMSYYSSHEDKSSIYLAKIRIPGVN